MPDQTLILGERRLALVLNEQWAHGAG